jgi:hypothetical protein
MIAVTPKPPDIKANPDVNLISEPTKSQMKTVFVCEIPRRANRLMKLIDENTKMPTAIQASCSDSW